MHGARFGHIEAEIITIEDDDPTWEPQSPTGTCTTDLHATKFQPRPSDMVDNDGDVEMGL